MGKKTEDILSKIGINMEPLKFATSLQTKKFLFVAKIRNY